MRHPNRSAWSLIELLICVAIVAVLAALLLPALSTVRDAARTAQCASNLRQIGIAFQTYTSQNRGMLPPTMRLDNSGGTKGGVLEGLNNERWAMGHWAGYLREMLATDMSINGTNNDETMILLTGVLHCPGSLVTPREIIASATGNNAIDKYKARELVAHSYGYSQVFADNWSWQFTGTGKNKWGTRMSELRNPGRTVLIYDQMGRGSGGEGSVSPIEQMPIDTQRRRVVSWAGVGLVLPYNHRPKFWWLEGPSAQLPDLEQSTLTGLSGLGVSYNSMRVSHRGRTMRLYADARVAPEAPYAPYKEMSPLTPAAIGEHWHGGWRRFGPNPDDVQWYQ